MEANESQPNTELAGASQPSTTSTQRLVIRVKIIPDDPPQVPATGPLNKRALAIALGIGAVAALALIWILASVLKSDSSAAMTVAPASAVPRSQAPLATPTDSSSSVRSMTPAPPAAKAESPTLTSTEPTDVETTSAAAEAQDPPEAPPSPLNEVIPNVPQSALDTIRGTVRVAVRVTIDQEGTVVSAASEIPGPSRYFERLSLEAARNWTFTPTKSPEQRAMLVRFFYTREGPTARAESAG